MFAATANQASGVMTPFPRSRRDAHGGGARLADRWSLLSRSTSKPAVETPNLVIHQKQIPRPHLMDRPRQVLCIDDDRDFANGLRLRFRACGFDVVPAYQSMTGFHHAFDFQPVAILLDLGMPDVPGDEILRRLKHNKATRRIPVVIMTGADEPGLRNQMSASGASDFFRKPVSHDVLIDIVSKFTDHRHGNDLDQDGQAD